MWGILSIKEIIEFLQKYPPDTILARGWKNAHSYRGYYEELGVVWENNVTIQSMIDCLKNAIGKEFHGYKGGTYLMGEHTDVFVTEEEFECTENNPVSEWMLKDLVKNVVTKEDMENAKIEAFLEELLSESEVNDEELTELLGGCTVCGKPAYMLNWGGFHDLALCFECHHRLWPFLSYVLSLESENHALRGSHDRDRAKAYQLLKTWQKRVMELENDNYDLQSYINSVFSRYGWKLFSWSD